MATDAEATLERWTRRSVFDMVGERVFCFFFFFVEKVSVACPARRRLVFYFFMKSIKLKSLSRDFFVDVRYGSGLLLVQVFRRCMNFQKTLGWFLLTRTFLFKGRSQICRVLWKLVDLIFHRWSNHCPLIYREK